MELNRELRGRAAEIILSAATFSTAALSTLGLSGCAARPEAAEASVRTSALDTGFSPQTQIRKDEAEYRIELLPSRNSEGLLIDGNHKITSYQDIDGNVYVVMKDNTFQSSIDSNQNKDMKFGGHIFYLGPRATVEQSVLDRAFKERVPSNSNLKEGQYEMTVTIPLQIGRASCRERV